MNEPTKGHIESDGLKIAYLDWGGSGDPLLMLHPNGFCAGFFAPLAARLTNTHRTIAVDLRGHGESDTPTNLADLHFAPMAADVGRVLEHLGVSEVALLGVSLGGGVGVHVADLLGPRMGALMLCEAIAFEFQQAPSENSNFMAALARKRRAVWPSREAMAESYGSRPPFGALEPAFLDAYVQWGTRIRPDNTIELACDPETEAQVFEIGATAESTGRAFELLAEVPCPVSVLAGADTDLGIHRFEAQAAQAGVELRILDGGHFFLQEDTDRAEALVRELLPS